MGHTPDTREPQYHVKPVRHRPYPYAIVPKTPLRVGCGCILYCMENALYRLYRLYATATHAPIIVPARPSGYTAYTAYTAIQLYALYSIQHYSGDNLHRLLSTRAKLDQYTRANYLLSKTYRTPIERCWVAASLSRGRRLRRHVRAPARSQLVGVALKSCFSSRSSSSARHSEPSCARSPTAALARSQAPSGRTRGGSWRRQAAVGG